VKSSVKVIDKYKTNKIADFFIRNFIPFT